MTNKTMLDCYMEANEDTKSIKDKNARDLRTEELAYELAIKYGIRDRKQNAVMENKRKQLFTAKDRTSPDYKPKRYVTSDMSKTAYGQVLMSVTDLEDVYEVLSHLYNTDINDIHEMKSRPFYYAKDTINHYDNEDNRAAIGITQEEHKKLVSKQKKMTKQDILDKALLKKAHSLHQQLRALLKDVNTIDRIEVLEDEVVALKKESVERKADDVIQDVKIRRLEELTGIEELPKKEQCKLLLKTGLTQKDIADRLGVTVRTIQRWGKNE